MHSGCIELNEYNEDVPYKTHVHEWSKWKAMHSVPSAAFYTNRNSGSMLCPRHQWVHLHTPLDLWCRLEASNFPWNYGSCPGHPTPEVQLSWAPGHAKMHYPPYQGWLLDKASDCEKTNEIVVSSKTWAVNKSAPWKHSHHQSYSLYQSVLRRACESICVAWPMWGRTTSNYQWPPLYTSWHPHKFLAIPPPSSALTSEDSSWQT